MEQENNERPIDEGSKEHSQVSNDTLELPEQDEFEENSYYLDMNEDSDNFKNAMSQLQKLSKNPQKKNIIQFITSQIKIASIKSSTHLDLLSQIQDKFWSKTIPFMLKNVVNQKLPQIPLLYCLKSNLQSLKLRRWDVYLILCHMFFVTIPDQSHCDISSFQHLYSSKNSKRPEANLQKLKCITNYFQIIHSMTKKQLDQTIVYERFSQSKRQYLKYSKPLLDVTISNEEIQTFKGQILIDFANRVLGGGVLFDGAVQQQILFVLHPQMMITKLICLSLGDNEVVMAYGIRQYSEYQGYSNTFKFKKQCKNTLSSTFVAIDAFDFRGHDPESQYKQVFLYRQIHKAYVGFHHQTKQSKQLIKDSPKDKRKIVTGKWGCGVFGGDPQLKFILQWMACSWASRQMVFVNWGATKQSNQLYQLVIKKLKGRKTAQIKRLLANYYQYRVQKRNSVQIKSQEDKDLSLFSFIFKKWA